jgi:hypothetical protein
MGTAIHLHLSARRLWKNQMDYFVPENAAERVVLQGRVSPSQPQSRELQTNSKLDTYP